MPFVHWDVEETHARREAIANAKLQRRRADHTLTSDQKLVEAYITDDHPLHIRRTLDQYYYHTLDDTAMRPHESGIVHVCGAVMLSIDPSLGFEDSIGGGGITVKSGHQKLPLVRPM